MFKFIDLDGGELPTSKEVTDIGEFPLLIRYIKPILDTLNENDFRRVPCYCFKFGVGIPRELLEYTIDFMEKNYKTEFYEVDGRKIFELRGPAGGVVAARVVYLISR